jgi:enhancing lycopene biosynthesis protein 2
MKRFAVVLCGCGSLDGSEIQEAVFTLLAIKKLGANYSIYAPDMDQPTVIDHLSHQPMTQKRNMLVEAARIARGQIAPLSQFDEGKNDALILPGGIGVTKNLCTYGALGAKMKVIPELERVLKAMHDARKPIGALCISPVILAKVFPGAKITLGQDEDAIKNVLTMGAVHEPTTHEEVVIDEKNRLFTGPCYMLNANIVQVQQGAENVVRAMLESM